MNAGAVRAARQAAARQAAPRRTLASARQGSSISNVRMVKHGKYEIPARLLGRWLAKRGNARRGANIALLSMASSMLIIGVGIYLIELSSLYWVGLAYFMGGMGWGTPAPRKDGTQDEDCTVQ